MRVLHVLNELRASGAEVGLERAAMYWRERGVDCAILSTGQQVGPHASQLERAGYEVLHLPLRGNPSFLWSFVRLIRRHQFDVVHVHAERAFVYLCLAATLAGAGTVRTVRAIFLFQGRLARRRSLQRRIARLSGTRFVAISASVAANEERRFSNPTLQISNWVDTDYFRPPTSHERSVARRTHAVPDDAMAVVTVGNCAPVKNHENFLRAMVRSTAVWIWLHVGEEGSDPSDRRLAETLGVAEQCRFLGRRDPLAALHAADVFAMPSLHEGLGMATVEALSTGLPALLTDVPGNIDLVPLSAETLVCRPDEAGLVEGLNAAYQAWQTKSGHVVGQHERVVDLFSVSRGVAAYAQLYADVAKLAPTPR